MEWGFSSPTQGASGPISEPVFFLRFARAFSLEYFDFNFLAKSRSFCPVSFLAPQLQSMSNRPQWSFPSKQAHPHPQFSHAHISPAFERELVLASIWDFSVNTYSVFVYICVCVYLNIFVFVYVCVQCNCV